MESINGSNASKGHVDNVTVSEAINAKTVLIALCKHVENVGGCWFCSIESRFSTEVHSSDISWIDSVTIDKAHNGHRTHGCSIFVNIGNGHCFQTKALVEFTIVSASHFSKITHVHVQTWEMYCNIINSNVDHDDAPILVYL